MSVLTKDTKYYVYLAITAVLIFSAKFWPALGSITEYGSTIVGIFIGLIFGYCTIGMIFPSFMAFIALGFSGYASVPEIMQMGLGNSMVLYIMSILILSAMLEKCGLTNKLVNWLVTRKFAKGRPWVISFMFFMAAYVASWFVNAVPPTIICWALLTDLFAAVGFKRGDKWPMVMMFGVLYTATLGAYVPSFQIGVVANYGMLTATSQGALVFEPIPYMIWAFICSVVLFVLYFLFAKYIIRPDVSLLLKDDLIKEDPAPLDGAQKLTIGLFTLFILGLLLPSILPADNAIKAILDNMGSCGWGLFVVLLAVIIRVDGKQLFGFEEMFAKGMIWDIVLMIATVFTIAGIITEERTGVPALIISLVSPMQNAMGELAFLIVISLIICLLANFTNTVSISCTFIPVLYVLTNGSDFNMFLFVALVNFIGNICFLMPSAAPNAAMMYSQKEWIPMKYCLIMAIFVMVSVYLVMMVVGLPLGKIVL